MVNAELVEAPHNGQVVVHIDVLGKVPGRICSKCGTAGAVERDRFTL